VTRQKGTPRRDGSKVRTYSYGCGAHISKGNTACQFNPIGQEILEGAVIAGVLEFYRRYQGPEGHAALVDAVRAALGVEAADLASARERLETDRKTVESTIANLLDNITPATRDLVGERLGQLRKHRADLELRRVEIERLAGEQTQVQDTVQEISSFIDNLVFVLRHGVGEEKMTALRRCVETVLVDKAAGTAALHIRPLPAPSISGTEAEVVGVRIDNRSSSSDPA
jgi:hypothetical protein